MRRISHLTDLRTLLDPWLMENHKPSQSFLELHGEMKVQIFSLFKGQGLTEDSLKECQANRSFKQFPKEEMTILTQVWFNGSIKSSSVVFPSISLLDCICHQTQVVFFIFLLGMDFYATFVPSWLYLFGYWLWPASAMCLCTVLHVVPMVCKAAGPRCALATSVLVLVTPSVKQSRVWLTPIALLLYHLGTLQSLAPHTSSLAHSQGRPVPSIYISVPCPQVKVE